MKPEDVPADLYDLALDALPGEPDKVISATTQEEVRAALAAVIPEIGQDWTRDTPDERLAVVRLSCGHAKIVLANVGVPGPGSSTRCDPCGSAVAALRYIAGGESR